MDDEIVLSYGDCLLRNRDVDLLKPPNWLNDALIGFAFEYLFNRLNDYLKDVVTMISPEVTQFIKLSCGDNDGDLPLEIFLEPLQLDKKRFVFLAINDQQDADTAGGNHWSLLVYTRSANAFVHYDSASSNHHDASRVATKISSFLLPRPSSSCSLIESRHAAKQSNGSDCGMFVICHAERLVDILLKDGVDADLVQTTFDGLQGSTTTMTTTTMDERRKEWRDKIFFLTDKKK